MLKNLLSKENGAITLFVLLALLFFMIVILSLFLSSSNKNLSQASEIDKIQEEYAESVNHIDQIYDETVTKNLSNFLNVGDFVNYTYDVVANGYSLPSTYSGYTDNQIIYQTLNLQWQILSINEDETVTLVSTRPLSSSAYFTNILENGNDTLDNKGIILMNDICKTLFSNSKSGIESRNLSIEDIKEFEILKKSVELENVETLEDIEENTLFSFDDKTDTARYFLRPVVMVNFNQILPCTGMSADGANASIEHMHQIKMSH